MCQIEQVQDMQDARFISAFDYILQNEGGFSNFRADPGGATKYGISLKFLKSYFDSGTMWADVNSDGVINDEDIMLIDLDIARKIYFSEFWRIPSRVKNDLIAIKFFDMCVNMGQYRAICIMQDACGLSPTGKWSEDLEKTINAKDAGSLLEKIVSCCIDFYQNLADKNPKLQQFLKGWINRANRLP